MAFAASTSGVFGIDFRHTIEFSSYRRALNHPFRGSFRATEFTADCCS